MRTGVELNTAYISDAKPFSATLTAKVPQRDGEALTSTPPVSGGDSSQAASTAADGDDGGESNPDDDWTDGGAAAAQAAAAAATAADLEMTREPTEGERPVGSWSGRPRVGVSKVAITTSAFEALGLALRYPSTRIFVRSELLAGGDGAGRGAAKGKGSGTWSFDSADVADLYPNLMKLEDAKARRSAADDIDAQFEVQKLRQQLESAVSRSCLFGWGRGGVGGAYSCCACLTVAEQPLTTRPRGDGALFPTGARLARWLIAFLFVSAEGASKGFSRSILLTATLVRSGHFFTA